METIFEAKSKGLLFSVFHVADGEYVANVAKGTNLKAERFHSNPSAVTGVATAIANAFGMKITTPSSEADPEE
jgi:hypothetical protein